jgi:hypothetical protein
MANINLLPENMREQERKELSRSAKKPKIETIHLSRGQKRNPMSPVKPPKRSLWKRIFGNKKKKMPVPVRPHDKQIVPSAKIDLLNVHRKKQIKYKRAKPLKQKPVKRRKSFWSFMGPAKSPIKMAPPAPVSGKHLVRPVPPRTPSAPHHDRPQKVVLKHAPKKQKIKPARKPGIGLMARLRKIFKPKKRPHTSQVTQKVSPVPTPKPVQKPALAPKPVSKFHMAPRSHKSSLDINLVPEELIVKKYQKNQKHIAYIVLAVIVPAMIIASIYGLIGVQQSSIEGKIAQLSQDKQGLIDFINGFQNIRQKNIRLQDKLLSLDKMLDEHVYWTKFFSLLERYTLDQVYYTEFTADTSGKFLLPAVAAIDSSSGASVQDQVAESYRKAAEQMVAFQQADDFVDSVQVNNLEIVSSDTAGIQGVKFELNVSLIGGVFNQE